MVQNQGKKCFALFQQYRKFTNQSQYSRYQNQGIVVFSTNGFKNNNPFVLDKSNYYRKLLPKVPKDDSDLTFYYNIGEWGFQGCNYKSPAEWGENKECINGCFQGTDYKNIALYLFDSIISALSHKCSLLCNNFFDLDYPDKSCNGLQYHRHCIVHLGRYDIE